MKITYEPDMLDDVAAHRAKTDPDALQNWEAIKLVGLLRKERETRGLSQAEVARRMNVPQPRIAEIERRPWSASFARILAYAEAVGAAVEIGVKEPAGV